MKSKRQKRNSGCFLIMIAVVLSCFFITQIYYIPLTTGLLPRQITLITSDLPQNQNPQPTHIQLRLDLNCQSGMCVDLPEQACIIQTKSYDSLETSATISSLMWELDERAWFTVDGRPFLPFMYPSNSMVGDIYFSFYRCFTLQGLSDGEHLITYESSSTSGEQFIQAWQILIGQ